LIIGNTDGIGLALTRALLADGWTVTGISRRGSSVRDPGYEHVIAHVSDGGFRAVLASAQASGGPLDVCVYCAGTGDLLDCSDHSAERAAAVVVRCLTNRPLRFTYPRRMGLLMAVARWLTSIRLWFG
jgi:NAD(P)-dependent dehydrogenase (short-subunit alcohol dehydrogenase family)